MSGFPHGSSGAGNPYGRPPAGQPYYGPPSAYGGPSQYGSPFASLVPSTFPPGTDPNVVACFQASDQDGSGFIDDYELQRALSSYNQSFSMRTVHLLMYLFTSSNTRKIGEPSSFFSSPMISDHGLGFWWRFTVISHSNSSSVELRTFLAN